MGLLITDSNGVDLLLNKPAVQELNALDAFGLTYQLGAIIYADTSLSNTRFNIVLNWNDGLAPTSYVGSVSFILNDRRVLAPGPHIISLLVTDYKSPVPNAASVTWSVQVNPIRQPSTEKYIYGPILPRDNGFPNESQWKLHSASDILVLESSVKMILGTAIGERIHEPLYGTRLKALLFEPNVEGIETLVQQEVVSALATWEPRVDVKQVEISRPDSRSVSLSVVLQSRISGSVFGTDVNYVFS